MNEMLDKPKENMYPKTELFELARKLNTVTRNTGTVIFPIKYTATDGNQKIHKEFIEYTFNDANNEYMVAIGKLLEYKKVHDRIALLEAQMRSLEEFVFKQLQAYEVEFEDFKKSNIVVEEKKGNNTF